MADNVTLPGSGVVIRTVANGAIETQVVKLDFGGEAGESMVTATNPMPVNVVTGGAVLVTGQALLVTAGTAVQLPSNTLANGIIITAYLANQGVITIGGSSVTNTVNGAGNGVRLAPGQSFAFSTSNSSNVWFNGTIAGDSVDFGGN